MAKSKRATKSRLKKATLPFYAEPERAQQLRELSARTRVPQQVYLREGLDLVLEKYKRAK
jgi:hypothetical protein